MHACLVSPPACPQTVLGQRCRLALSAVCSTNLPTGRPVVSSCPRPTMYLYSKVKSARDTRGHQPLRQDKKHAGEGAGAAVHAAWHAAARLASHRPWLRAQGQRKEAATSSRGLPTRVHPPQLHAPSYPAHLYISILVGPFRRHSHPSWPPRTHPTCTSAGQRAGRWASRG